LFNATFSNISAISWRPVLVVEEGQLKQLKSGIYSQNVRKSQIFKGPGWLNELGSWIT
jgi:hypothetical protein